MLRPLQAVACVVAVFLASPALGQTSGGAGKYVMGSGGAGSGTGAGAGSGGSTGGSASGSGDVYGDLVQVLRDATTGRPILEKRWILGPQDTYLWGYCPIALTAAGEEIPFLVDSCDPDPAYTAVAIDYFGRLDGARTVETNFRMHFDEVVKKINAAQWVTRDAGGRLYLATECTVDAAGVLTEDCTWTAIDSSQESMAVYQRIMKYGHLQTDPMEVDPSADDPALGDVYHPALKAEDYAKFIYPADALLPVGGAAACFASIDTCVAPKPLTNEDFVLAAGALAGSADKTGLITVDLVQYFNRMVDIPVATATTAAPAVTLPALIRDCKGCSTYEASCTTVQCDLAGQLPAPANERFVDWSVVDFQRPQWFNVTTAMIKPSNYVAGVASTSWVFDPAVPILPYLDYRNAGLGDGLNIDGFVRMTSDSLRTIELFHNYKVPLDLWDFVY